MEQVRFNGKPLFLDGKEYIVPSLSLRQVRDNHETLSQTHVVNLDDADGVLKLIALYAPVIGMALRRNYPDVTDEQVLDWLDLSNFAEAVAIVQAMSGYRQRAANLGEAMPAPSTGETLSAS